MARFSPIALIILAGLMPLIVLGVLGTVLGQVAWKPPSLWADQFGGETASEITSVDSYPGGLFAAGYVGLPSLTPRATESVAFFLKQYDLTGSKVWTQTFGNETVVPRPTITVGADGVYFAAVVNGTTQIRKYGLKGNELWDIPIPRSNSGNVAIPAGTTGLYAAGSAQPINPSQLFVAKYDPRGIEVWSHEFGNSSGVVNGIYAGASNVYVVGWVVESLPGQTMVGKRDAFMVRYDFNGNLIQTDEFGGTGGDYEATGVSGDPSAVYVSGLTVTGFYPFGFVRKYGLDGSVIRTIQMSPPDLSGVFRSFISSDASGVYLSVSSAENSYVMKYDSNGNQVWSFQLDDPPPCSCLGLSPTIAVGSKGVFVAGTTAGVLSGQQRTGVRDAFVREFGLSNSLIFFGLNPPYSFAVVVIFPIGVSLGVLSYRTLKKRSLIQQKDSKRDAQRIFSSRLNPSENSVP